MSTAIALKEIPSGSRTENYSIVRQRNMVKQNQGGDTTMKDEDLWLDSLHDVDASTLPLDTPAFAPTSTYWVTPHGLLTKDITILDLTKDISVPYLGLNDAYKEQVKKTLKDHCCMPAYTCHRNSWLGLQYSITNDQDEHIADWKHPWASVGEATLTFPEGSSHSSHPISMRNKRWGLRTEIFTVESQPFLWETDSLWHSTNLTLYKVTGKGEFESKTIVAKYAQKWWGAFVTGGTVVVDEKLIDGFVACLTLCVVLKKKRQRAAETKNPHAA